MQCYRFDFSRNGFRKLLVIYDVQEKKKRTKLAKFLEGYGKRVQLSAFEMDLPQSKYNKMMKKLPSLIGKNDKLRVYHLPGEEVIKIWDSEVDRMSRCDMIII